MTRTQEHRMVYLIVDGEYVYDAPYRFAGRAPLRNERANYGQLRRWVMATYDVKDPEKGLEAHYVHHLDGRAGPFYEALRRLRYTLQIVERHQQHTALRNGLRIVVGQNADEGDCVVYVGGDDGSQEERERNASPISRALHELAEKGLSVHVLALKGANDFDHEEFRHSDLVTDVEMMPRSLFPQYQAEQTTEIASSSWADLSEPSVDRVSSSWGDLPEPTDERRPRRTRS